MSLDQTTLAAQSRKGGGKGPARRLRTTGAIPAVIYGKGFEPMSLSIDPIALKKALATPHKFNTVITVKLEGAGDKLVLLKDYQQHPLTRQLLHADFQEVRLDQPVLVEVPVVLTGKAIGLLDGGILNQVSRTLQVSALPRAIPVAIEADVTGLKIAQTLHATELKLPEGVTLIRKTATIAVMAAPEAEVIAAPVAAAPGAAGAAPAAGAAAAAPAAGGKAAAPAAGGKAAPAAAAAKAPAKK